MKQYYDEGKMHHSMGKQMNNQTWGLLSKTDRSEDDNEKMVYFHYQIKQLLFDIN